MTPTIDEYVHAFDSALSAVRRNPFAFRARLREKTIFGPAGRAVIHEDGERVLLGPGGERIRVVEKPEGGVQIEHGDHLHAAVRTPCVTVDREGRLIR